MPASLSDNQLGFILGGLTTQGFALLGDALSLDLTRCLREEAIISDQTGHTKPAGIGRQDQHLLDKSIRRSRIAWLDGHSSAQRTLLAMAEELRVALNRQLFLGLFSFEAHYAVYPIGGFYKPHMDAFAGRRNRVVSFVAFLDEDWNDTDGGALAIWPSLASGTIFDAQRDCVSPAYRVKPEAGTMVLMLAEDMPHAVEVTRRPRHAIAGWWRIQPRPDLLLEPLL